MDVKFNRILFCLKVQRKLNLLENGIRQAKTIVIHTGIEWKGFCYVRS